MRAAEIILILCVALIVFGPEHIPGLARNLGRLIRQWKSITLNLSSQIDEQMKLSELEHNEVRAKQAECDAKPKPQDETKSSSTSA